MARTLTVELDTSKLVKQLAEIRLLVSRVGFALDNYLLSQPPQNDGEDATPDRETGA